MIQCDVQLPGREVWTGELPAVPDRGHTLVIDAKTYTVADVAWRLEPSRRTRVTVFVLPPEGQA